DVRLLQLDILVGLAGLLVIDPLVVVVDGDREDLLRAVLTDHVLVEDLLDLCRLGDRARTVRLVLFLDLLGDDVVAQTDALVTDVDGGTGDQLLHLLLRFAAEGAGQRRALALLDGHFLASVAYFLSVFSSGFFLAVTRTSSIKPYSLACEEDMKLSRSVSSLIRSTGWPVCLA